MVNDELYAFVFKGLLTEESLDKGGRKSNLKADSPLEDSLLRGLGIDLIDDEFVKKARKMSAVYVAITAFENSVREFIEKKLLEERGEGWWQTMSGKIQGKATDRMKDEEGIRWLSPRGKSPIYHLDFGDLVTIMGLDSNWPLFEIHINDLNWARTIFSTLERSRNIIMHGGELSDGDVARIGIYIRDWINQVG